MKIHFDNVNFSSRSGPNTFGTRLAQAFFELGHEVIVDNGTTADISLIFIERSGASVAKKIVQRIDGIWFKPEEFQVKNVNIKSLYNSADCVIWQSDFDRKMILKHWKQPKRGVVIRNGIKIEPIKNESKVSAELMQIRNKYDTVFTCSSNWHPQKRFNANVILYKHLKQFYPNSCLIVMGSNPPQVPGSDIFYTNNVPHEVCMQVYAISNWMLHLAWLDHSPNVVVEALSQNTPVICSDSGGTHELVRDFGVILQEDVKYEYQLLDYDRPPYIDVEDKITEKLPEKYDLGEHANIDITQIAKRYLLEFENILS